MVLNNIRSLFCALMFAVLVLLVGCKIDDDLQDELSIYDSPLAIKSRCQISSYDEFDADGLKVKSLTFSWFENGCLESVNEVLVEYDEFGNFMYFLEIDEAIYPGIIYKQDSIIELAVINLKNSGITTTDSFTISESVIHSGLNSRNQPERSISIGGLFTTLEDVAKTYDNEGNLTYEDNQFGIARWDYRSYEHDDQLRHPIPTPGPFQDRFNAVTTKVEKGSVETFVTEYQYSYDGERVTVRLKTPTTEYVKYEVYFICN